MSILGRDGNLSFIRVGTIAAIIGILLIVIGIVLFLVDRASRQVPLEIEVYPGASLWFEAPRSTQARQVVYRAQGATAEDVVAYYQRKLTEFSGGNIEACVRFPDNGNYEAYDRGDKTIVPYYYSCMFDRSGFQVSQYTRVNIQPGIEANDSLGITIIEYEQYWQR